MIKDDEHTASRFVTIIPAEPGWQIAIYCEGCFIYERVVAWEIVRERCRYHPLSGRTGFRVSRDVMPLTTDGTDYEHEDYWLKRPDGLFDQPYNTAGGCTEQKALASCEKHHREDAERQKQREAKQPQTGTNQ
jgi:hypothetical protein